MLFLWVAWITIITLFTYSYGGNQQTRSVSIDGADYQYLPVRVLTSIRPLNEWVAIRRNNRRVSPNQFTLQR